MNLLFIFAHPNHESLNYALLEQALAGSKENQQISDIRVLDLYAERFNPVLTFGEQKRRRDMHQEPALAKYREQILWADKLIFIYPIWWGRPPAMLLGYMDQVFASGFAYRDNKGLLPEGLLAGKSAVCISTMKGPALYPLLWLGNAHKMLMKRGFLRFVGIKAVRFFEFGSMEKPGGKQTAKLNRIRQYFQKLG